MTVLLVALLVGTLFATGTYLILRREPIKLIFGLNLLSYGVNVLLFSSSAMRRGTPPIVADKATFTGDIAAFVDPLPQALILTAIVISFGITAFLIILVNRRNALTEAYAAANGSDTVANDPFGETGHFLSGLDADPDDYVWLEDTYEEPTAAAPRKQAPA
jgi:multicomponent Na+:H+ antiporter subunit C